MPAADPEQALWTSVLEALRGSRRDYTTGPVSRAILVLAIPMVLEMVMESVFAVCDVFFVSRLGPSATATIGLTESILALVYALAMGLAVGAMAMVARRTGARDADGAANAAVHAIALGIGVGVTLGLAGGALAPALLRAMGASADVLAQGSTYARVMIGGNVVIVLLFLINAIFRGAGDAAIAMRVLWLANGINILLGPCLIFGLGPFPELGVTGAAVATTIGRGIGVLFAASRLLRPTARIDVQRRHLRLHREVLARLTRLSSSGAVQALIGTGSWIALIRILSTFGSEALAGYTIGIRVILFALLPSWGLSNAAATMVGQSLGARKPDRAVRAVWIAGWFNAAFLGAVGIAFIVFAHPIVSVFSTDETVVRFGTDCLRIVACGFPFYAWGMVLTQSFNGAGDTRTPTLLNFFVFWCWEIPLSYLLGLQLHMGPRGVYLAMVVAFCSLTLSSAVLFRRGRWQLKVL